MVHAPDAQGRSLADLLMADETISNEFGKAEIRHLCDPANYLGMAEPMVDRVLAAF